MTLGRAFGLIAVAVILGGCDQSETVARHSPTPPVSPGPSLTVLYQANYGKTLGPIHQVTLRKDTVRDRVVMRSPAGLLANSTSRYAVLAVPRSTPASHLDGQQLGVLDLNTGALRVIDTGSGESLGFLTSPDETKILIEQQVGIEVLFLIVDLATGETEALPEDPLRLSVPLRWTTHGIVFASGTGALAVDPQTFAVARINIDDEISSVSPNGRYLGGTAHLSSSNPLCLDSLFLTTIEPTAIVSSVSRGKEVRVISQPLKSLWIVDVGDDGSVIYAQSNCPSNGAPPSLASSLYYYSAGQSTLEFSGSDSWSGRLLDTSTAILERQTYDASRKRSGSEVDSVALCTGDVCRPKVTVIAPHDPSAIGYSFDVVLTSPVSVQSES